MLNIASWNINSVRLRINLLTEILTQNNFDVICLQETKTQDEFFPEASIKKLGYNYLYYRGEKSYNGVAILSKIPFKDKFFIDMCNKGDKRHVAVILENDITIHNFYIPAGGDEPDTHINPKFAHKLQFLDEMANYFEINKPKNSIILGDFNIAPNEHDVWSHKQLKNVVSHTAVEIEKLSYLAKAEDWLDAHRLVTPLHEKLYSWWSYRAKDWLKSNRGRRLDHIWFTPDLKTSFLDAKIHQEYRGFEKPSDHTVISTKFRL
ncbi:MAG: exodeoxyribonuclease III [Alphaproteobacteria bacterium]|jgi:exodeoxyribonuclease III|nr:exodeoxyribonuclease III [Alphaproteobacteria bacterium]MBT5827838.1 exodeoxyribonuclease III [Alphaproteobacteria bacterium]